MLCAEQGLETVNPKKPCPVRWMHTQGIPPAVHAVGEGAREPRGSPIPGARVGGEGQPGEASHKRDPRAES